MTQELIYTSAPSGLKPGSKGFCTVAATNGIAPRTVTLLESLSGYRHTFPPAQSPDPANPVAWMHLHTPGGDSLLSRVADAGLDYSGRSNKIAHHVILSPNERTEAGPTAMMRVEGNLIATWSGPTRWLAARTPHSGKLPPGTSPSIPATTWRTLTGDAGWAGVLAQAALSRDTPECYVIYGAGQENKILTLFDEALVLLPPSHRWQVTLSTFFCKLPPGMSCQWRGILKGSPEHRLVPPHKRVVKIDLTADLTTPPDGPLVHYARTGQAASAGNFSASLTAEPIESSGSDALISNRSEPVDAVVRLIYPQTPDETVLPPFDNPPQLDLRRGILRTSRNRRKSRLPWFAATTSLLLILIASGAYAVWQSAQRTAQPPLHQPTRKLTEPNIEQKFEQNVEQPVVAPEPKTEPDPDHKLPTGEQPAASEEAGEPAMMADAETEIQTANVSLVDSSDPATDPKPPPLPLKPQPDPQPEPVRVSYLLEPAMWRQLQRSGDRWSQDQSIDRRPSDLTLPTTVEVLTLDSTGEMTVDEKFSYNAKNFTVSWGEPDRGKLQPPSKVVRFEPKRIVLQVNYAQRIRDRFLFANAVDEATLLTLYGAVTPGCGMDGRLPVTLSLNDETPSAVVPLGAINPGLLAIAEVTMRSSQPDRWHSAKIDEGIELERSFGKRQQLSAPPTRVKVNVRFKCKEEPRLIINATIQKPGAKPRRQSSGLPADELDLGSTQTARNELPANHIDVDLVAELRWQIRRYTTTLSQFRIAFE